MLRKALLKGLLVVSVLAATSVASAGTQLAEGPTLVAGAPFSAMVNVQSTTTFSDGNRIVRTNSVRYFRDGQGRTRTERLGMNLQGDPMMSGPAISICDPVKGQRLTLFPKFKSATAFKLQSDVVSPAAAVSSFNDSVPPFALLGVGMAIGASQFTEAATSTTSLGQKDINGLAVTGSRIVRTIPVGVLGNEKPIVATIEQWVSPDLGMMVQFTETSSLGGSVTVNLSQIVRTEPDSSLFVVPADYKVQNVPLPELLSSGAVEPGNSSVTATASASR